MKPRRTCVAVGLLCCLLTFATSAYAECAWVLWTHAIVGSDNEPKWSVSTATQTLDQCRNERSKQIVLMSKLWDKSSSSIKGRATETGVVYGGNDAQGKEWVRMYSSEDRQEGGTGAVGPQAVR